MKRSIFSSAAVAEAIDSVPGEPADRNDSRPVPLEERTPPSVFGALGRDPLPDVEREAANPTDFDDLEFANSELVTAQPQIAQAAAGKRVVASTPPAAPAAPFVTERVTVVGAPPTAGADHPSSNEERASLAAHQRLTDPEEIAERLLPPVGGDQLPPHLAGLYTTMLDRAASVLRVRRTEVEAVLAERGPKVMTKIGAIHEWAARDQSERINASIQYRRVFQALPEQLDALLETTPGVRAQLVFSDKPDTWTATLFLTGDITREAKNVLSLAKPAGIGGVLEADGFRFEIGDGGGNYPSLVPSFVERLAQALREIDDLRKNSNPTVLGALARADRGQVERLVDWIEARAATGHSSPDQVRNLLALRVDRFPDMKARLDAALLLADLPSDKSHAERWVELLEESAARGYRYERAVTELGKVDLAVWPDLAARFRAAVESAQRAAAERWLQRVEAAATRGVFHAGAVEAVGQLDLARHPDLQDRFHKAVADSSFDGKAMVAASEAPEPGNLCLLPGQDLPVFIQRLGREFTITEVMVEKHGPHLIDHIGRAGVYVTWRLPTRPKMTIAL